MIAFRARRPSRGEVGVISLPDGRGQVVITVFIKKSNLPFAGRERVIAEIGPRHLRLLPLHGLPAVIGSPIQAPASPVGSYVQSSNRGGARKPS